MGMADSRRKPDTLVDRFVREMIPEAARDMSRGKYFREFHG